MGSVFAIVVGQLIVTLKVVRLFNRSGGSMCKPVERSFLRPEEGIGLRALGIVGQIGGGR